MKKFYLPILCLSMLTSIVAFSQAGSPDPTFNGNGLVSTFFFPEAHTNAFGVMVQNDNAIVVTGFSGVPNSKSIGILLRYLEDGSPDQSFNGSGKVYIAYPDVHCLGSGSLQQPDGKIVTLVRLSGLTKDSIALFRFNPDGTSDFTFDEDGIATLDMGKNYQGPGSLAIQSDGKLVVGGYVGNANESFDQFFIARFLPNGAHDTGFDGDGFVITTVGETYTNVASVLIQPDGKIIAAGYATFDSLESITVVRYLPNGALDHTFHQDGISHITIAGANAAGTGAILQPDGKIVVGGNVNVINSKSDFVAVRFKSDGYPDNSFDGDGISIIDASGHYDGAASILLQPDNKIVLGGYAHSDIEGGNMALVRLNSNGIRDFSFDGDGISEFAACNSSDFIYGMAMQADGKIIAAGLLRNGFYNNIAVARFLTGLTVSTKEETIPLKSISLYPNPICEKIFMEYDLEKEESITIKLLDIQGRLVETLLPLSDRSPGQHTETLSVHQLPSPGNYFVSLETRHNSEVLMVVVK